MSADFLPEPNKAIDKLIERVDEIAVLPHVVYKVLEQSATTDTAAVELERTIVVDPGFSTKLLTLANSAFYGLPRKVTSIRDAITFLGFKQIRQLAMTVGFFDMFVGKNDKESLRRRAWWRHSIDTAICCRWLAGESRKVPPDEAYTSGLLHFIGKPLLDRHDPTGYEQVEHLMATQGLDDLSAEQEVFGGDHIEVAIGACTKWRLPEQLVSPLSYRVEPPEDEPYRAGRSCVALSSAISSAAVDGPGSIPLPEWAMRTLGFDVEKADDLLDRAISTIASSRSMPF